MANKPSALVHLHTLPEDERIETMANFVRQTGKTVSVITDSDPGKAERYLKKIRDRHPDIAIVSEIIDGPVAGTRGFKIGPQ